nr:hypothetical protein [candidate division Zixibacteria bacterium]
MKQLTTLLFVLLCLFGLIFCHGSNIYAAENSGKAVFIDRDGDGFDDIAADDDGDGIPNGADPNAAEVAPRPTDKSNGLIDFSRGLDPAEIPEGILKTSDLFNTNQFNARGLSENRCGFTSEEGFGSGTGVGINDISGGGGCVGGVCH